MISQAGVKNKNISVGHKKVCRTMLLLLFFLTLASYLFHADK